MTGLGHTPRFLQQRAHQWLVEGLLDRQDRQAVEGQTAQRGQTLLARVGGQLFIGLLGLLPGVLVGIGLPQGDVEVFDLRGLQHNLLRLMLLEQSACLFIVADGVFDGKDGHGFIPGLHAVARGGLGLS